MPKKILASIMVLLLLCAISIGAVVAQETRPNNIFGIHLNQPEEQDIKEAAALVNSTGGDWGYVTFVIPKSDRDVGKWNQIANQLRRNHLNWILRIATESCSEFWCRPSVEDASSWADFLAKLKSPSKSSYVIFYNEPNHGKEWGGEADPAGFAHIHKAHADALKQKNTDFKVAFTGFGAAAPQRPPLFYDQAVFWREMLGAEPALFDNVDCIASHSYANHGYRGPANGSGRNSVRSYQWELSYLQSLGITKDLCVLITETGRPHREGVNPNPSYFSVDTLNDYYQTYYPIVQSDLRIVAVTPFMFKDCGQFEHFSWIDCVTGKSWPFVDSVKAITKVAGEPDQRISINVKAKLPITLVADSTYKVSLMITNGGQAWLDIEDGYRLGAVEPGDSLAFSPLVDIQPNTEKNITMTLKTGEANGEKCQNIGLFRRGQLVAKLFQWCYKTNIAPSLDFKIGGLFKTKGEVAMVFINQDGQDVYKEEVEIDGAGRIEAIRNVVLGDAYTVSVAKKYSLPQKKPLTIAPGANVVEFDPLVPIDFDNDGEFTLSDLLFIRKTLLK